MKIKTLSIFIFCYLFLGFRNTVFAQKNLKFKIIIHPERQKRPSTIKGTIEFKNKYWRILGFDKNSKTKNDTITSNWVSLRINEDSIYVLYKTNDFDKKDSANYIKFKVGTSFLSSDIFNFGNSFFYYKLIKRQDTLFIKRNSYYFSLVEFDRVGDIQTDIIIDKELLIPLYIRKYQKGEKRHSIDFIYKVY